MNDLHSPLPTRGADAHLDHLLRGFYRAEMPDPWPQMDAPEPSPKVAVISQRRHWFKIGARLALAASIGFILVAYLALAQNFPRTSSSGRQVEPVAPDIGQKPRRVTTPRGREALMLEQIIPGDRPDRPTFKFELQVIKGPNGRSAR